MKEGELYDQLEVEVEVTLDGKKTKQAVSLGDLRRAYVGAENKIYRPTALPIRAACSTIQSR